MTPADSNVRPELFLHDSCLPEELRPPPQSATAGPTRPSKKERRREATKLHLRRGIPDGFRWPPGTVIHKGWTGELWQCSVSTEDGFSLLVSGHSSFSSEAQLALAYLDSKKSATSA
jgi:hypothetical protein